MRVQDFEQASTSSFVPNTAKQAWLSPAPHPHAHQTDKQSIASNKSHTRSNPSGIVKLTLRKNVKVIEKYKTLLSLFIKNKNTLEKLHGVYKNKVVVNIIAILWISCHINFLAICCGTLLFPRYVFIPMQVATSINFCLHHLVFIRVDIVKELAKSFNFWFSIWNVVSLHVCVIMIWVSDIERILGSIHSISSIVLLLILYDAHGSKHIFFMKFAALMGCLSLLPLFFTLFFRLVKLRGEAFYLDSWGIELVNWRLQAIDNFTSLIIYLLRIIYNHFVHKRPTTIAFLSQFYEIDDVHPHNYEPVNPTAPVSNIENGGSSNIDARDTLPPTISLSSYSIAAESENCLPQHVSSSSINALTQSNANKSIPLPELDILIDHNKHMLIGIMDEKIVDYNLHDTIYHRFVIQKFPLATIIMRSRTYHNFGVFLCVLSSILSLPISIGINFGYLYTWLSTVSVVLSIVLICTQIILTSNLLMIRHMVRSFDYWYVMFLIVKVFVSYGILCDWDIRMVFWFYGILAFNGIFMVDSFGARARNSSYISILGIIWALTGAIICKVGLGNTFSSDRSIKLYGVQLMSSKITISSSLFSISLFLSRFLWSFIRNNKRILFITENIRVEQIAPREPTDAQIRQ